MFPVYLQKNKNALYKDEIAYIIGKDGIYIKKKCGIVESVAKVSGISFLEDVKEYASLDITMIPENIIMKSLNFFKKVYSKYSGEAIVILLLNETTNEYSLEIPKQEVSGASVSYQQEITSNHLLRKIGTIHSHCNFSAFHSGVDRHDELGWDGIHITIGNISSNEPSISGQVTVNKSRFSIDIHDYIELSFVEVNGNCTTNLNNHFIPKDELFETPEEWLSKVTSKHPIEILSFNNQTNTPRSYFRQLDFDFKNIKTFNDIENEEHPCLGCPMIHYKTEYLLNVIDLQEEMEDELDIDDFELIQEKEEIDDVEIEQDVNRMLKVGLT